MAEDLVELGLEGFDFVTDRYHDAFYDRAVKVGPKISKYRSGRKRSASQGNQAAPINTTTPTSQNMKDNYYSDEDRGRRNGRKERDGRRDRDGNSGYYEERGRVEDWARRSQGDHSPNPQIKVNNDNAAHVYPPPPQPMQPPYPTAGQLVMPPDAYYPPQRSHSENRRNLRAPSLPLRDDDDGYYDNDAHGGGGTLGRSRSANHGRRSRSRSGNRERSLDRGHRRRSARHSRDLDNPQHSSRRFNHVTTGLAGALAGGFLGREMSKGDLVATVAGALVGALGAGAAEKEWDRHKERHRKEEEKWDGGYGRR